MKKILITVPTLLAGGMERSVVNFAEFLIERGIEVKIFMISSNEIFYSIPPTIEVVYGKKNLKNKWLTPWSLLKLRRTVVRYRPDVVLSFSGKISVYVVVALKGLRIPVIPFHRGSPYKIYGWLNDKLNKMFFPNCAALAVQTETAKSIFSQKFNNGNIIVVPNPVRRINIDENVPKEKIVITVSRLVKGKGLENLVRIFDRLRDLDWSLHILGDGYLKGSIQALITELDLDERVKILGFRKNVDTYLSTASIFAFSSESEGFPNALLEAMCGGLACVSFDCPTGPSEMISHGENGYLVPLGELITYEKALREMMEDEALRIRFGREAVKLNKAHSPKNIVDLFVKQVDKLLQS